MKEYLVGEIIEHHGGEEILVEDGVQDGNEAFGDVDHSTDGKDMTKENLTGELIEGDQKGKSDNGPKPWGTEESEEETSYGGWTSWLPAIGLAIIASIIYS